MQDSGQTGWVVWDSHLLSFSFFFQKMVDVICERVVGAPDDVIKGPAQHGVPVAPQVVLLVNLRL